MFTRLKHLAADPILGLMQAYRQDTNPNKVDLGVGVYKDTSGHTPILKCIKQAEAIRLKNESTKAYIGPPGEAAFNSQTQKLIFGEGHKVLQENRARTGQTPGGCGALRVAAEFLMRCNNKASIWVSDPTWDNHIPLLGSAGLNIKKYPYYDYENRTIRFDEMMQCLAGVKPGDLVLLHGCCHNPCGADLNGEQWKALTALAVEKGFTPFIDLAYQGFGDGIDDDVAGLRYLTERVDECIVASSCSKNFGLYRERTGSITVIAANSEQADAAASQVFNVVRSIYSMPPAHGAALVSIILQNEELTLQWHAEVAQMRDRINGLRRQLTAALHAQGVDRDFSFIEQQRGMFSFLGISEAQVKTLCDDYSIYIVNSSRINVAGINDQNIDYVAEAVAKVIQ